MNLKLKKKCHIVPPEWLSVGIALPYLGFPELTVDGDFLSLPTEVLQDRLTHETSNPGFSQLPFRFAEISKVVLDMLVRAPLGYGDEIDTR